MRPVIDFIFTVVQVKSNADGSPRITLDLLQPDVDKAAMLWAAKLQNLVLRASITAFSDFSPSASDQIKGKNIKFKGSNGDLGGEMSVSGGEMSGSDPDLDLPGADVAGHVAGVADEAEDKGGEMSGSGLVW